MDSTTVADKRRPPFLPPGCSNLGAVSPVSDCHSFLAQRQWFYRSPRKTHIAINTSTAVAVEGRRRGCLEPKKTSKPGAPRCSDLIGSRAGRSNPVLALTSRTERWP
ncbi:hypothetical protein MRX96_003174 [Rhipicephalus microplus]